MTVIIYKDNGLADPFSRAYIDSVDRRNRLSIRDERYHCGRSQPNYQVPTLIGETFIVKDTVAIYHTNRDAKIIEMIWWENGL